MPKGYQKKSSHACKHGCKHLLFFLQPTRICCKSDKAKALWLLLGYCGKWGAPRYLQWAQIPSSGQAQCMWQIAGVAPIPWPARLWPRWPKLHVKENAIGFLQLSWYQLFGKPQHHPCGTQHGWFWHIGCSSSFISSPIKLDKVCKVFSWKLSLGEPNGHHLGKDLLCPNGRSLGQGLAPASWPQFFLVQEGLGQSPYWFMFLSLAKREGRNPNLWRVSGMWNCQCHFFIKDISGKAWWKVWMACSTAGNKVVLVMRPVWFPSWTWSMKAVIARKAWQASGLWPLGIATLWMKCLMIGNMAKHSEAWQVFSMLLMAGHFFLEK